MLTHKNKTSILLFLTAIGIASVFFIPPIPQNNLYHNFADARTIMSIPNFYNVVSNFPLFIFGILGIIFVGRQSKQNTLWWNNLFFFTGILLTGIGSAYYHFNPRIETLVWDRLPMTITFMAFFAIIISEYVDKNFGKRILFHLIFFGILSVLYWYKTEMNGAGDLRFYALIQFLPMLLIPLIILMFKSKSNSKYYWLIILAYGIAKLFEAYDQQIFVFTNGISGHALKHLAAALAPLIYLKIIIKNPVAN